MFALTRLSTRRKPFLVPKNLFAAAASTAKPKTPACARIVSKSNSDVLMAMPLPRMTSKPLSIAFRTSPASPASAATFTAPAACLKPGTTGKAMFNAPSTTPDIKLYAREPSVKTVPAKPRPTVQAWPPVVVPR